MSHEYVVRNTLEILIKNGLTEVKTLIKATGASESTVYRVKKRIKEGQGITRRPGSGRPSKLKSNDKRIAALAIKHPRWSRKDIAQVAHERITASITTNNW